MQPNINSMNLPPTAIELTKIPHLNITQEDIGMGRYIPLFALYDEEWKMYTPIDIDKRHVIRLKIEGLHSGLYFSKTPIKPNDIYLKFFHLMFKHNNFIENQSQIQHIMDDLENLLACAEKVQFFGDLEIVNDSSVLCKYAAIELESIFQNSRAIFENLEKIQHELMKRVVWKNGDATFQITEKIQFRKNNTKEQYINEFKIPELLANFYYLNQGFFFYILEMRNDIFHSRKTFGLFLIDKDFYISLERYNLNDLAIWDSENTKPNNLGSLNTLIDYIIKNTIYALELYADAIFKSIRMPDDMVPEYNIFYRHELNQTLIRIMNKIKE